MTLETSCAQTYRIYEHILGQVGRSPQLAASSDGGNATADAAAIDSVQVANPCVTW